MKNTAKITVAISNTENADIVPGKSIRIYGERWGSTYDRTFEVGDTVEYDSFNLSYFGTIKNITAKTVVVEKRYYHGKTARMKLVDFAWRNRNFHAAEAAARNHETMMYI